MRLAPVALSMILAFAACGGGGEEGAADPARDVATPATAPAPEAGGDLAMPPELADFPLPDDAWLPFPPTDMSGGQDPRATLIVTVNSTTDFDATAAIIDAGLPASGYTVEASQISTTALTFWEWSKDGLPGLTTVGPDTATGGTVININLFRSGTR